MIIKIYLKEQHLLTTILYLASTLQGIIQQFLLLYFVLSDDLTYLMILITGTAMDQMRGSQWEEAVCHCSVERESSGPG